MSRCKCCNEPFHPTIEYDDNGKFVRFEDTCNNCLSLAYQEESYDDIFEPYWVKVGDKCTKYVES